MPLGLTTPMTVTSLQPLEQSGQGPMLPQTLASPSRVSLPEVSKASAVAQSAWPLSTQRQSARNPSSQKEWKLHNNATLLLAAHAPTVVK